MKYIKFITERIEDKESATALRDDLEEYCRVISMMTANRLGDGVEYYIIAGELITEDNNCDMAIILLDIELDVVVPCKVVLYDDEEGVRVYDPESGGLQIAKI